VSTRARRLRDAVIAIWLIAAALFARFPIAPLPLPGISLTESVNGHAAFGLAGGLIIAIVGYGLSRLLPRFARS
jgi:hypothetical protein